MLGFTKIFLLYEDAPYNKNKTSQTYLLCERNPHACTYFLDRIDGYGDIALSFAHEE